MGAGVAARRRALSGARRTQAAGPARLGHRGGGARRWCCGFAVGACVLLGGAAIVSAAMGRWPDWATRPTSASSAHAPTGRRPHARTLMRRADRGALARPRRGRRRGALAGDSDRDGGGAPRAPARRRRRGAARASVAAPAAVSGEETSAVTAAMRALRVEQDPVRARGLLARYLAEHATGTSPRRRWRCRSRRRSRTTTATSPRWPIALAPLSARFVAALARQARASQ